MLLCDCTSPPISNHFFLFFCSVSGGKSQQPLYPRYWIRHLVSASLPHRFDQFEYSTSIEWKLSKLEKRGPRSHSPQGSELSTGYSWRPERLKPNHNWTQKMVHAVYIRAKWLKHWLLLSSLNYCDVFSPSSRNGTKNLTIISSFFYSPLDNTPARSSTFVDQNSRLI